MPFLGKSGTSRISFFSGSQLVVEVADIGCAFVFLKPRARRKAPTRGLYIESKIWVIKGSLASLGTKNKLPRAVNTKTLQPFGRVCRMLIHCIHPRGSWALFQ